MPRYTTMRAALLAALGTLPGCDEFQAAVEEAVGAPPPVVATEQPPDLGVDRLLRARSPAELASDKVARYAECMHRSAHVVVHSEARWRATVGKDGTPVKRRVVPEIVDVDDVRAVCEAIDAEGRSLPPSIPELESEGSRYVDALRRCGVHTKALAEYYRNAAYADDDWALGKRVAPTMALAFGEFAVRHDALSRIVDTEQEALDRTLSAEALARDGKSIEWYARESSMAARAWMRCVIPPSPDPAPTLAECDAAMAALSAAATGLQARRDAEPEEATDVFWMTSYAHSVAQLRRAAEALHAAPPAGPKQPKPDSAVAQSAFREVVLDYGQLRFAGVQRRDAI